MSGVVQSNFRKYSDFDVSDVIPEVKDRGKFVEQM
jgi:hypothetical protein